MGKCCVENAGTVQLRCKRGRRGILENIHTPILGLATQELENDNKNLENTLIIFQSISYTHFSELIKINDNAKRHFY